MLSHTAALGSDAAPLRSGADKANRTPAIGIFEPFLSCFHTPLIRVFTHRAIVFSHTESRVFTHRRLMQPIDPKGGNGHFLRLNLLNDSYLTDSFNVSSTPRTLREKVKWNRPMADPPSFRAAFGITRAAQAPLAKRERSGRGSGQKVAQRPSGARWRAGKGPSTIPGADRSERHQRGLNQPVGLRPNKQAATGHAGSNRPANSRSS